jgi:uncharacterized protein DUF4288
MAKSRTPFKWYGVKTLHRVAAKGRPVATDRDYSRTMTYVEERVVLFRARSFDAALALGEAEAKRYSRSHRYRNRYGQQVRSRYIGYCDAYVFEDQPTAAIEVYSSTEVVPKKVTDGAIIRRQIGERERPVQAGKRKNILDIVFAAPAPGVRLTKAELAFVLRYGTLKRRT